ncbi:hypothetical protein [Paraburkholderia adhaesiva]|uniref:hypothetical protein n=1 Tax=Paraburkholderia adhaesiva TaxID=2883244 RepID=UPI001F47E82C|nr:hypothetical protein [Paraburkholderia adhaesiva]
MEPNARPVAVRRHLTGDRNQCPSCGEFFNSTAAFDAHRTGPFGGAHGEPSRRRCLTVVEMRAKGMALNRAGFWVKHPLPDAGIAARVHSRPNAPAALPSDA